jgi:enoyl-CoA hydratase/carnithine racemase
MDFDEIRLSIADGVGEIVLDRPDQLNPISARAGGTRDQIVSALDQCESDPSVGCVLIRGAGEAFSAGGDLTGNARRDTLAEQLAFVAAADAFHRRVRTATVPVIAAVHGYCLGAALNLALACDFVIAGEGASFGLPEGRIGLVGAAPLVPVVGSQWATFLMITGELIDARTARQIGLVLVVEPDDELLDRTRDLAGRIARMPRQAVRLNRRTIEAVAAAGGDSARRSAALDGDAATLAASAGAAAPDGRSFTEIIAVEGIAGLKAARQQQYREPWLRRDTDR